MVSRELRPILAQVLDNPVLEDLNSF